MWQALICPLRSPVIERRARGVEMHFASLTLVRTSAGPPEMKPFRRRCQALAAAPGRALLSRRRLSGCAGPRDSDSLESHPGLYSARVISRLACLAIAAAVFQRGGRHPIGAIRRSFISRWSGGRDYSLFTMTQDCGIWKTVVRFHCGGVVFHLELKNVLQPHV